MDCIEGMKMLPDGYVNTIVTSPPYLGLRDYGVEGQIGLEQTPEEYVAKIVEVSREGKRVLRDDGTLWLNLGDCYSNTKAKPRQDNWVNTCGELNWSYNPSQNRTDLPPKNLVGIPWRVAFALQADGWYLRSDIIWSKPNPMPESVTDRPTKAHEYIFLFSKSSKYYYDAEAIKEPSVYSPLDPECDFKRDSGKMTNCKVPGQTMVQHRVDRKRGEFGGKYAEIKGKEAFRAIRQVRNKRDVWTVPTKPFPEAHFATFPPDLIKPCILAGCQENGIVLDMFMGAGTTAVTAFELGRNYLGFELNKEYCEIAERRIETAKKRKESLGIPLFA